MLRKNELCTIDVRIKGRSVNSKQKEIVFYHHLANAPFGDFLKKIGKESSDFEKCLRNIPKEISKIYQKIGIDSYDIKEVAGIKFYHFSAKFIFREKEKIKTYDRTDHSTGTIELEGEKFQYNNLHFTVIPSVGSFVADSKCTSKPLQYYFKMLMDTYLDVADYKIDPLNTKMRCITVEIRGDAKEDYKSIIQNNFQRIQSFGLTFGKANKKLLNSPEFDVHNDSVNQIFAGMFGKLVGVDVNAEESPFMGIKIDLKFKQSDASTSEELARYKDTLSETLLALDRNDLLKEASVEYLNDNDEIEVALRRGVVKSRDINLDRNLHDSNEDMWKEQVVCYTTLT